MNGYDDVAPRYAFGKILDHIMTNCNEAVVGLNMRQSISKKALGSGDETKKLLTSKERQIDCLRSPSFRTWSIGMFSLSASQTDH